jgi:hypothetical protein
MTPESEINALIDSLRSELPQARDQQRVKARLLSAGIIGASVATTGAAAALGSSGAAAGVGVGAELGLLSKLAGLSLGAKLGAASLVVAAAVAIPVTSELLSAEEDARSVPVPQAERRSVARGAESPASAAQPVEAEEAEAREAARALLEELDVATEGTKEVASGAELAAPAPQLGAGVVGQSPASPEASAKGLRAQVATRPPLDGAQGSAELAPNPGEAVAAFSMPQEPSPNPATSASTLRAEAELIERALGALRAGDRATALAWLTEHARRFPQGQLARERQRALDHLNLPRTSSGPTR